MEPSHAAEPCLHTDDEDGFPASQEVGGSPTWRQMKAAVEDRVRLAQRSPDTFQTYLAQHSSTTSQTKSEQNTDRTVAQTNVSSAVPDPPSFVDRLRTFYIAYAPHKVCATWPPGESVCDAWLRRLGGQC